MSVHDLEDHQLHENQYLPPAYIRKHFPDGDLTKFTDDGWLLKQYCLVNDARSAQGAGWGVACSDDGIVWYRTRREAASELRKSRREVEREWKKK